MLPQRDADSTDDNVESRNKNSNSSQICLDFFRQSMSPEQFDQLVAVSNDEDNPSVLFSIHPTTFQRFVDAVNAYPVHPPLGLVFTVPVSKEALMVAILDFLRGAGTPNPSSAPIGLICLPCTLLEFSHVASRITALELSDWYAALKASAPGIIIGPIASVWTMIPRHPKGGLGSMRPLPVPPMSLWD